MMMCIQTKNPARIVSGAGFLVSVCAVALSVRGPAPPVGKQDEQSKQQARQQEAVSSVWAVAASKSIVSLPGNSPSEP